jgi:hypothetical protein
VVKTCKSNGIQSVAIHDESSGERVRNTWATFPEMGDSSGKLELIPHVVAGLLVCLLKLVMAFPEGLAAYQLVGGVTAHQGKDG